jgi:hypothetical protein
VISRLLASHRRDEGGSVMIAVIVVGVIGLLVATTLDTVTSGLNLTRTDQNRINAFQFANAGVDKAVYRLDRNILPTSDPASPTYTPTLGGDGTVVAFTERLDVGPSSYEIQVAQDPPGQTTRWKVMSLGTDRPTGRQRLAIATIAARPLFENGFFTVEDFYLTGNQDSPLAYNSNTCPAASTSCELNPVPGGLGTNAKVIGADQTVKAFVERWREFNMYGRATQEAAEGDCGIPSENSDPTQARCKPHGGAVNPVTDQLEYPIQPAPAGTQACPNGGNIGVTGLTTTIEPGDYTCENLTFRGTVNISPAGTVRIWPTTSFVVAADAVVNRAVPTKRLQIYFPIQSGGGSSSSICGGEIWGLLFTPGLEISCGGSHQPKMYGAVIANLHGGTGNHFDFHWDLAALYAVNDGKYVVRNWRECPVGTTDC